MTACTIERSMPATSVAPFSCPARQSDLIVCWDQLAEFANQVVSKGRLLYVGGRLSYRVWSGPDGQPRHTTEIVAGEILLLDRPPAADAADSGQPDETAPVDGHDQPF